MNQVQIAVNRRRTATYQRRAAGIDGLQFVWRRRAVIWSRILDRQMTATRSMQTPREELVDG
jgi:hypothetical protein